MGYLLDMQREVQQFAEVISEALGAETEIIDENMAVVGSTSYNAQDYAAVWDGSMPWDNSNAQISKHIFETKRPLILEDPGENPLCDACTERNQCYYKAGLYYPILRGNTCYGIISLVAFNQQQRETILKNSLPYMKFIRKMADILSAKISEVILRKELQQNNHQLQTIISALQEGVIACDEKGIITFLNRMAEEKLSLLSSQAIGKPIKTVLPNSLLAEALSKKESLFEASITYKSVPVTSNVTLVTHQSEISGAVESFNTDEQLYRLAHKLLEKDVPASFTDIIGSSTAIEEVKVRAAAIAKSPSTVLITGESGTGKELFARSIHRASLRAEEAFVPINCSAIPDSLLESELFGYEGGAFTGARTSGKPGLFEMAKGGTIFLDEIGDMPLLLQSKLLRVLQEKKIQRVGGTKEIPVDVRVITATHRDLEQMIAAGQFRQDLYYRLNVIPITIPPLRSRPSDIPELAEFLCRKYGAVLGKTVGEISREAMTLLCRCKWPGNVRQLENAIEYAVNYTPDGTAINADSLPQWLTADTQDSFKEGVPAPPAVLAGRQEKQFIEERLALLGADVAAKRKIAEELGVSLATLYRKMKKYAVLSPSRGR